MAIYHLEAKVVSRGTGRSAVAASAYLSCSKILNDYDGCSMTTPARKDWSGRKYSYQSSPHQNGKNGACFGTP